MTSVGAWDAFETNEKRQECVKQCKTSRIQPFKGKIEWWKEQALDEQIHWIIKWKQSFTQENALYRPQTINVQSIVTLIKTAAIGLIVSQ